MGRRIKEPVSTNPLFANIREYTFVYRQELGLTGLIGREMSVSYLPCEGLRYKQLISNLQDLYQRFRNEQHFVYIVYRTSVYIGEAILNKNGNYIE